MQHFTYTKHANMLYAWQQKKLLDVQEEVMGKLRKLHSVEASQTVLHLIP